MVGDELHGEGVKEYTTFVWRPEQGMWVDADEGSTDQDVKPSSNAPQTLDQWEKLINSRVGRPR